MPRVRRMLFGAVWLGAMAQGEAAAQGQRAKLPIAPARTIAFETTEGTMMNVDLSPDGRTIVFDLLGDLYTVPVTGGRATQLTRGLGYDRQPVWSPDGAHLAYVSDASGAANLWVMAADGTNPRPVAPERTPPDPNTAFNAVEWLPDGRSLVSDDTVYHLTGGKRPLGPARRGMSRRFSPDGRYVYIGRGPAGVWRHDRTAGESRQLAGPPVPVIQPVVSPDGRWLAYVTVLRAPEARGSAPYNGLRIRNLETGEDRWLAYPIDKLRLTFERFVFTPDSRAILIGYGGKLHRIDVATGTNDTISFTVRVQVELGSFVYHQYRVTNDSLTVRYIRSPTISPDGKHLVFTALQRLYTMALPDGMPRRLLPDTEQGEFEPAFSPDGKWIAYVTWSGVDGGHVWRVRTRGGRPQRLTARAGYYQRPAWSPDGRTLAVLTAGPQGIGSSGWLQLLPSTGGTPRTVLEHVSREAPVTFTPDGQHLLIQEERRFGDDPGGALVSVRLDGRGRRVLARGVCDEFGAWQILPSPDRRYVAYSCHDDLYLARLAAGSDSVALDDVPAAGRVVQLAHGALDVRWARGGEMLMWLLGNRLSLLDPDRAMTAAPRRAPDAMLPIRLTVPRYVGRGTLALHGARVITMRGNEVFEDATLVITNDRISAVGPASAVTIPEEAKILDMRGKTILPGLVDLHAHFARREDENFLQHDWTYLTALAYGVTTARDPSSTTTQFGDAELLETGRLLGPRLFSVGKSVIPNRIRIESVDDARAVTQHRKAMGAVVIKQYEQPSRRRRQWVLQAAAEAGVNVTNEAGSDLHETLKLISDGTTGVEHTIFETSLYGDVTRLMAAAKTWYTPTFMCCYGSDGRPYFRDRYRRRVAELKYRRFVPYEGALESRRSGGFERRGDPRYKTFVDAARRAAEIVRQGGHVTIGSHGEDQGLGVHWDLWALRMGGLTNHEALRAATLHGIQGLGLQQDLGSLEVGKIADLLVLDRNPLDSIENTLSIRYVMKNGILYDGNTLNMVWPEHRALPAWMYAAP